MQHTWIFFLLMCSSYKADDDVQINNDIQNVEVINEEKTDSCLNNEKNSENNLENINDNENLVTVNASLLINQTNSNISTALTEAQNVSTNASSEVKNKFKVECLPKTLSEDEIPTVQITNSSTVLKVLTPPGTSNVTVAECIVVLFYSSQCVFSARMAPHYNALPRVFPDITFYAVDIVEHNNLYIRFGLVFVPNLMLFHNSKPIARFNETTLNLENFVKFVNKYTGLEHNGTLNVTSVDMNGPVPSVLVKRVDYWLILAWAFTLSCLCFGFAKSSICHRIIEFLKNTWQEAEAQHEHED